jgi:hypothetical protein
MKQLSKDIITSAFREVGYLNVVDQLIDKPLFETYLDLNKSMFDYNINTITIYLFPF